MVNTNQQIIEHNKKDIIMLNLTPKNTQDLE